MFAERKLRGILSGTWIAQAVYVAAKFGVPDLLSAGPRDGADLAAAAGADPTALRRVLRAHAAAGVLRAEGADRYALTPVGELLRSGAPGGGREMALMQGEEVYRSFAEIEYTVRTGLPAFDKVYGRSFYAYLEANPQAAAAFHGPMGAQPVPAVLSTVDFTGVGTVVDVGGGSGALVAWLLDRHPALRGVVLDLPAAAGHARQRLASYGDRAEVVATDFTDPVPAGEVYLLSRVLHNWLDGDCADLLTRIRATAAPGARLVVLEKLLDPDAAGNLADRLGDLLVLATQPGRDRTAEEYRDLIESAGFRLVAVRPGAGGGAEGVIEAVVK